MDHAEAQKWMDDHILPAIVRLVYYVNVYRSWNEALSYAPDQALATGLYHSWIRDGHIAVISLGVRREADSDSDSTSFYRFLSEVRASTEAFHRDWYYERVPDDSFGIEPWDEQWLDMADPSGEHLSSAFVTADLKRIDAIAGDVRLFATRSLAHRLDPERRPVPSVSYADLHDAVEELFLLLKKWYLVIFGTVLAAPISAYWEHVLTVPWVTEEEAGIIFRNREIAEAHLDALRID